MFRAIRAVKLVGEIRAIHDPVANSAFLVVVAYFRNASRLRNASSRTVRLGSESLAVQSFQKVSGENVPAFVNEIEAKFSTRQDYLFVVTHGLQQLAEKLVTQRITLRIDDFPVK